MKFLGPDRDAIQTATTLICGTFFFVELNLVIQYVFERTHTRKHIQIIHSPMVNFNLPRIITFSSSKHKH